MPLLVLRMSLFFFVLDVYIEGNGINGISDLYTGYGVRSTEYGVDS